MPRVQMKKNTFTTCPFPKGKQSTINFRECTGRNIFSVIYVGFTSTLKKILKWEYSRCFFVMLPSFKLENSTRHLTKSYPIPSMYGIFTYIWLIFMVNVGKYTIHGSYGYVNNGKSDISWSHSRHKPPLGSDHWTVFFQNRGPRACAKCT